MIALHRVKDIREAVGKEIDWLNESILKPYSIGNKLQTPEKNAFKSMLFHNPAAMILSHCGMTPNVLVILMKLTLQSDCVFF